MTASPEQDRFEKLVAHEGERLRNMAWRYSGKSIEPGDLLQETLIAAWRRFHQYRGDARFSSWMGAIMRNIACDHYRASRPDTVPLDPSMGEWGIAEDQAFADLDTTEAYKEALGRCEGATAPVMEALGLYVDGLTYSEIAAVQQVPKGTVRSRIWKARLAVEPAAAELGVQLYA